MVLNLYTLRNKYLNSPSCHNFLIILKFDLPLVIIPMLYISFCLIEFRIILIGSLFSFIPFTHVSYPVSTILSCGNKFIFCP